MWVGKFKIKHDDWVLESTVKFNVELRGNPLNSFSRKGKKYHTALMILYGRDDNKKKYIESLKSNKMVTMYSLQGNQLYVLIEGEDAITHYFKESLFLVQPVHLKQGYEYWELSAWQRKELTDFHKNIKKIADVELLKLKSEIPSVFIKQPIPQLTQKQQQTLELAQSRGYYRYPRKISVDQLAKIAGVPRTTFQEHLRRAEAKMMNFLLESEF